MEYAERAADHKEFWRKSFRKLASAGDGISRYSFAWVFILWCVCIQHMLGVWNLEGSWFPMIVSEIVLFALWLIPGRPARYFFNFVSYVFVFSWLVPAYALTFEVTAFSGGGPYHYGGPATNLFHIRKGKVIGAVTSDARNVFGNRLIFARKRIWDSFYSYYPEYRSDSQDVRVIDRTGKLLKLHLYRVTADYILEPLFIHDAVPLGIGGVEEEISRVDAEAKKAIDRLLIPDGDSNRVFERLPYESEYWQITDNIASPLFTVRVGPISAREIGLALFDGKKWYEVKLPEPVEKQ